MNQEKVKVECRACGGTGLYKGFAEPEGHAVVCSSCGGKGYKTGFGSGSELFTGRKKKAGIRYVLTDGGLWMCRGANLNKISIQEFYNRYPE